MAGRARPFEESETNSVSTSIQHLLSWQVILSENRLTLAQKTTLVMLGKR
jgi:hypothetical protein